MVITIRGTIFIIIIVKIVMLIMILNKNNDNSNVPSRRLERGKIIYRIKWQRKLYIKR